ncbi:MAG: hypothetical protein SGILL_005875, partial [Bacillariaceae sp.]
MITSPGRLNIRNAIKNLRAPRSPGNLKNFEKVETEEQETAPLTVEARVDNVLKSIVSRRSSIEEMKKSEGDASETEDETNDAASRTEFLISEHSNRTLVVDNKKNKSQNPILPDTPWSSRNLAGSSRLRTNSQDNVRPEEDKAQKQLDGEAEYGTLALKSEDAAIKEEEEDESLPPEVVAMSAASEKLKLKSKTISLPSPKKSRSLDD